MPNWVANRLIIEGEGAEELLRALLVEDKEASDGVQFDFNKILPMPKELNIISGTITNRCAALYLMSINPNIEHYGGEKVGEKEYFEIVQKVISSDSYILSELNLFIKDIEEYEKLVFSYEEGGKKFDKEKALSYGKQAVDNILKYNAMTWYSWCSSDKNWGTKWNACETMVEGNSVRFNTAWSDIRGLIRKLSEQFPKNSFVYEYCEEQPGYYCGVIHYKNGNMNGGDIAQFGKDAYKMYFDFWGGEEDYRFDEASQTYEYIEEELEM